jgi:hypothetical protein
MGHHMLQELAGLPRHDNPLRSLSVLDAAPAIPIRAVLQPPHVNACQAPAAIERNALTVYVIFRTAKGCEACTALHSMRLTPDVSTGKGYRPAHAGNIEP